MNVEQNILVVTIAVIVSILFEAGLNQIWPWEKRRTYNELIGWQLSVLGTTYAVILGFMLYTVWTAFGEADLNVDLEASAVVDIHHLAKGLPEPQRTQMQTLARSYADAVITRDWPQMVRGEVPEETGAINAEMWDTVMSVRAASATEITAQQHMLLQLGSLDQHRFTRILQRTKSLPKVLWCVLLAGGDLTIISACTFGAQNMKLPTLHVFFVFPACLALSCGDRRHPPPIPWARPVCSDAFVRAQQSMQAR